MRPTRTTMEADEHEGANLLANSFSSSCPRLLLLLLLARLRSKLSSRTLESRIVVASCQSKQEQAAQAGGQKHRHEATTNRPREYVPPLDSCTAGAHCKHVSTWQWAHSSSSTSSPPSSPSSRPIFVIGTGSSPPMPVRRVARNPIVE